jgi:nucleotide-binding universal stress UspA family protein
MKKILVAIDGSEASLRAGKQAVDLAAALGGEACFIYVVPPVMQAGEAPFTPVDEMMEAEEQRGQRVLDEAEAALGKPAVGRIIRVGVPHEVLIEVAEKDGFDLLIMGSRGLGPVRRLLLGSVADKVVHACRKPVMVIH